MSQVVLIKIGGSILENSELLQCVCQNLMRIQSAGISLVIVHGGGPAINYELTLRGIQWEFYQGQRITTHEMMEVIEMTLCGKVNRQIVRTLNTAGLRAVGMAGTDGKMLLCSRAESRLGNVGVVKSVDVSFVSMVLSSKNPVIPVIAPVGVGGDGNALNVNADWAASFIAQALGINRIVFLTDQDGILDAQGNFLPELDSHQLEDLVSSEVVEGGMLTKVRAILNLLNNKTCEVRVINGKQTHALAEHLLMKQGEGNPYGTRLYKNQ